MKASDLFIKCLEAEGVDTIFGIPGEENADFMISLLDSSIEFVICRHEQAAAFMADMYGRMTGKPGVCLATLGPGATNLTTGLGQADMDCSPVVGIIGQAGTYRLHKESHQNMDAVSMFKPLTKWATTVMAPDNIPEIVRKAFKVATSEKPGVTVIELPEDIAKGSSDLEPIRGKAEVEKAAVDLFRVAEALKLIAESKFPVALVGLGCVRARARTEVEAFLDKSGIYGAETFMGKGALSIKNDHAFATVGLGARDLALEGFEKADLVITLGYDMVEWHPDRWNVGEPKKIIHIDTQPAEVDKLYNVDVEIIGDIRAALSAMTAGLAADHTARTDSYKETMSGVRQTMKAELAEHNDDDGFPMKPQRILSDLRSVMGADDILISDVGAHKMWVARQYPAYEPATCIISNGFCSMAGSVPGAMAAKRVYPDRNIVALCGDGGFMMNVQDMITAVRYDMPITVLLWVDKQYGLIKWKQEAAFGKYSNIKLVNPDFVKLADAFGWQSIAVGAANELVPALNNAFNEKSKPTLVIVPVDYEENMKLTKRLGEIIAH
ncbi:MAG: acetolactate synthase large subunit [Desulfobacterales bacterium]|nr:acetolactate synthase large subunit [Desulfobacterales bacterium]